MPPDTSLTLLAEDLWIIHHPLHILGANFGRNTTIIRLSDALLIHSSAPFSEENVHAINALGTATWAIEATLLHDTFTDRFSANWPTIPLFAPQQFKVANAIKNYPLSPPPADWKDHIDVLKIDGVPQSEEYAIFHRASRTLIMADIVFNLSPGSNFWTKLILRSLSGLRPEPDVSRLFRMIIKDRAAFSRSIERLMAWDFDRVIVGHGRVIETNGKQILAGIWRKHGFMP
ncbi:hypothetical protein FEM03_16125 [Phragmitibacter flavus]|uniref:DUF4336 domain-containing protein n=1 Tax=Phragmitibacter flavus TaxID=2576071 RepID=A0A5R8KC25_9BACT|nr:hypothetical protein [Phragmitibacter flavus]TLD69846.1 hypothetical protein FEM03_16125 [Phragmitibacter flavus]